MTSNAAWTDDRIKLLGEMRGRGRKSIWEALNALPGKALTKSAVTGKMDRLFGFKNPIQAPEERAEKLAQRREKDRMVRRAQRRTAINVHKVEAARAKASGQTMKPQPFICRDAADIVPLNITLLELTDETCRWPYGSGPYFFCGHMPEPGKPYCGSHSALAYNPPPPRKPSYSSEIGRGRNGIFGRAA